MVVKKLTRSSKNRGKSEKGQQKVEIRSQSVGWFQFPVAI